ncbi:MAG: outer membrane lipoprotein carrier protein LolA [Bacteroidales bacterium]|nr:outer membrane lipoprotein carrier protein LolA [Bacteroidales bacterium]
MYKLFKVFVCASLIFGFQLSVDNPAQAQITHNSQGRLDENATAALKKAAAQFDKNVSFTVTMTVLNSEKKQTAKQSAEVRYHKGKYRLILPEMEVISDGTTVWQWNKQAKEVAIHNMVEGDVDLLNPGHLLANYSKSFKAKYIRTDDDGTAVIDMQPNAKRSYHKIRIFVDEESGLLKRMEVHKYDSGREIYDISGFKRAANAASQFTFDPAQHSDVEVIDMR